MFDEGNLKNIEPPKKNSGCAPGELYFRLKIHHAPVPLKVHTNKLFPPGKNTSMSHKFYLHFMGKIYYFLC